MKTSSRQLHLLFTCHVPMTVTTCCVTADLSASATPCSLGAVCQWMYMKWEVSRIQQAVIYTFLPNSLLKNWQSWQWRGYCWTFTIYKSVLTDEWYCCKYFHLAINKEIFEVQKIAALGIFCICKSVVKGAFIRSSFPDKKVTSTNPVSGMACMFHCYCRCVNPWKQKNRHPSRNKLLLVSNSEWLPKAIP